MNGRVLFLLFLSAGSPVAQVDEMRLDATYPPASSGLVSASDLAIPARARKSFEQSEALIRKQDFAKAVEKLNQAITIYPAYALAYNNLGVVYARLGQRARGREALERAISLNDRLILPYMNLGRMNIGSGDFLGAEKILLQASLLEPADPSPLVLLAYAQMMQGRLDEAIATCRKAHTLSVPHSLAHRVAARTFLQKGNVEGAIAELEAFLRGDPTGPEADGRRKELEAVQAAIRARERGNVQ
jgi:Flp pilus assembly protein TadD